MKHLSRGQEGVFFYNNPGWGVIIARIFKTNLSLIKDLRVNIKKHIINDRIGHGIKPRISNVSNTDEDNNESNIKLLRIYIYIYR